MLIGIAGQMQCGKDTIAKIIQSFDCYYNEKFNQLFEYSHYSDILFVEHMLSDDKLFNDILFYTSWKRHGFADKLKEIVAILFGCTVKDLHNNDFKNSPLPDEWQTPGSDIVLTYRFALQQIGTELFRNKWHHDTWILSTLQGYKPNIPTLYPDGNYINTCSICGKMEHNTDKLCRVCRECWDKLQYPNWVITDCRFLNEIEAVKEKGGYVIKVERNINNGIHTHASETEQNEYNSYDYIIENNGTLNELIHKIKNILIELKLFN